MIDKTIEELKQIKQTLEELQRKFAELTRENEFLKETNAVLSKELTKNSIMQQDHIETCCGIPIREIPLLKEQVAIVEKRNRILEERWQKIREWINEFHKDVVAVYPKTLLDKMKELEIKE